MLEVKISKRLGNFILHADFQAGNEILGVLGPSGCGKSVTLRCIAGIETPDDGHIAVNARTLFAAARRINIPSRLRKVGYVFQNYALFPHLTVKQNIAFGLKDMAKDEKEYRVHAMLKTIRMEGYAQHLPAQLSGGQQQRVSLARTLITRPDVLLLDEPFSALDNHIKRHLENELLEIIRASYNGTVLLVTHNIEEAHRLCDRILVYENGKTVQIGDKHEVTERPATAEVARVVGCHNLLYANILHKDGRLIAQCGALSLRTNCHSDNFPQMIAGFHSYHVRPVPDKATTNTFHCRIRDVREGTAAVSVTADYAGQVICAEIDKHRWEMLAKQQGDMLYLHIPPEKIFLVPINL
ncbi:MAG: ATP-binding cassette domain-containing protein [Negativicutes bacterium]|nr:ATP-binding cassette domain-containing protein [Negativicutes bacterium]